LIGEKNFLLFFFQVGDPDLDHSTWLRPEDVKFVRKSYKIDPSNPGTEVAAETAAALAAASIVLRAADSGYADMLLLHARDLFEFADNYRYVTLSMQGPSLA